MVAGMSRVGWEGGVTRLFRPSSFTISSESYHARILIFLTKVKVAKKFKFYSKFCLNLIKKGSYVSL